jgi:CDP-glucose 4,6-dehydratase
MTSAPTTNFWRRRRVFVTGATGLLGGWLTARLRQMDAEVVCLIRDWVPRSNLIRSGMASELVTVRGDVRDQTLIERALAEYEIQTVYHLAAQTTVGVASASPVGTLDTNIRGTWVVLEACRATPTVEQVVFASSDKAYGASPTLPYDEDTPLRGVFPYDVSKSCADLIAQAYARSYDVPVAITRCANLYGGGDLNWNRLIPGTIRAALLGERPVIRSDGMSKRDTYELPSIGV